MKSRIVNRLVLPVLTAALALMAVDQVRAQTFTTLYYFSAVDPSYFTNYDGAEPEAGLLLSGGTLYGTTVGGGYEGSGTVFTINTNGSDFTNLVNFSYGTNQAADSQAALVLSQNVLYGTTVYGANYPNDGGTVFSVNTDGTGFSYVYAFSDYNDIGFTNGDGGQPSAAVTLSGNRLYGTASVAGASDYGAIFSVNTDGSDFTNLHSFSGGGPSYPTNSDGSKPTSTLVLSGNTLYGTSQNGGTSGIGTVFAIETNGSGYRILHSFLMLKNGEQPEGAGPYAGVVLSGDTLYGTTAGGGKYGMGAVFSVNTNGSDFTNLYSFSPAIPGTNSDGDTPLAGLVISGATLYGTASSGGPFGSGTVFSLNTDGSGFTTLYSFSALATSFTNSDGSDPNGLVLSGNTLYGTAQEGGSAGSGMVFSLSLGVVTAPLLTIALSGTNVTLTWPTNAAGLVLQSVTNLASPVWTVIGGQNPLTIGISSQQQFFRLATP